MEDIVTSLISTSPSTAGVIVVVVLFLRYLERAEQQRMESLKNLGDECHKVQERCVEALDKNTETLGRNTETLRDVEVALAQLKDER